ncbi:hypothetical protein C6P41_004816 [Kluyveromyces marxianus]|nr:hypothetical protein C6P43_001347 [Kluyveromyces marxianus]KAG0685459.1 hypothetical protein C6P41_004816 [Kluyveromyces marxianus]
MSNSKRTTVYDPLDISQIAFIPADLDSDESFIDTNTIGNSSLEAYLFHQHNESTDLEKTTSHISTSNSLNTISSSSSEDVIELISQTSNAQSLSSNVMDGIRYKIVLNLTKREIKLIRDSWNILLSDEGSVDNKSSSFFKRVFKSSRSSSISQGQASNLVESSKKSMLQRVPTGRSAHGSINTVKNAPQTATMASSSISSSLFCAQFYSNFLSMDPNLEKLYPSLKHQATAFAGVLTMAINNLEDLTAMEAYLNNLGKRHARVLGIHPPQFEMMGIAFLRTIRDRFGVYCTFELEETWARLYSYLANSILQFGIDPILKVDFSENELHLPVPNLIENTTTTKIQISDNKSSHSITMLPDFPGYP